MGAKRKEDVEFEPLLDLVEISRATGFSKSFIRKHKSESGLPHYKIGKSVRYRLSEVSEWIRSRKAN